MCAEDKTPTDLGYFIKFCYNSAVFQIKRFFIDRVMCRETSNLSHHQTCNVRKFSMNTHKSDLLLSIRQKLDAIEIHNSKLARFLYRVIPASCPFASDIKLFGNLIIHIPPLCKLNPLYEQLIGLRFRALSYLAHLNSNTSWDEICVRKSRLNR
ncbi:Mo-dependent nitrogenase family protein (plasmid) [Fischerella sp. NIES-4106]|nr:Mo-dependent nitrogenase family protein [Fischerella sp. NIES-4106]